MNIQALEYTDHKLLIDLQPVGWPDILPHFEFYINSTFCFPIKILVDGKIIGIGAAIIHQDIAWLGHIIVHPDYRNKGIGQIITQTLVDQSKTKNCQTIYLIATDLGLPIYQKVGFETETEYLFFKDIKIDPPISKNAILFNEKFREQLFNIDRQVTGESRILQLEEHIIHSYIYQVRDKVEGYYLPTFGEGLIIATNASAGIELMKIRLKKNTNAAFPIDNLSAINFLNQNNCIEFKRAKRMRLGIKRAWEPAKIYNRIGGNIG